jgi:hypothetical protein
VVSRLKTLSRILVRHRFLLSAGLSAAAGIILKSIVLIPVADPLFRYTELQRPKCRPQRCGRVYWLNQSAHSKGNPSGHLTSRQLGTV